MGKATIDLPDPMDVSADTGSAGTDDLLAQLAGEEIDRLIAESDNDSTTATAADRAPRAVTPATANANGQADKPKERRPQANAPSNPAISPAVGQVPADAPKAQPAVAAQDAAAEAAPEVDLGAGIDALFSQLKLDDPVVESAAVTDSSVEQRASAPAPVSPKSSAQPVAKPVIEMDEADILAANIVADEAMHAIASAPAAAPDSAEPATAEADLADLEAAAEKNELSAPILHEEPDRDETESHADRPASFLVRVLELFNAPMSACPESVRESVGKIAVITLVNAVAVLAYVLIFRRR
ncbi:MAG: hypothetical protein JWP03_1879 [Phycisphaerales bacterium]|nr:hypothetical protein [Phycisphaerales bacterium]